jgi:hypothetical protein
MIFASMPMLGPPHLAVLERAMCPQVFISYASPDLAVASQLCDGLGPLGFNCWLAPREINPGDGFIQEIVDGIRRCDALLVLHSLNAANSPWVPREVHEAVVSRAALVAVCLQDRPMSDPIRFCIGDAHHYHAWNGRIGTHLKGISAAIKRALRRKSLALEADAESLELSGIRFARVPAGWSPSGIVSHKPYYLATLPVSEHQWNGLSGADDRAITSRRPADVIEFISELAPRCKLEGLHLALPTLEHYRFAFAIAGAPPPGRGALLAPVIGAGPPDRLGLHDLVGVVRQLYQSRSERSLGMFGGSFSSTYDDLLNRPWTAVGPEYVDTELGFRLALIPDH